MPIGDILPELSLILGAATIVLLAAFLPHRRHYWCTWLALLTLLTSLGLTVAQWPLADQLTFHNVWAVDRTAVFAKLLILAVTAGVVVLSPEWIGQDKRHGEYYALVLFAALGAIILASAHDGMELVMGVLLSSAASYPLVAFHRQWALSTEAGLKYFLAGALANGILLIGVILLFGLVGDTDYAIVRTHLTDTTDPWILIALVACITAGLCFKLAAFPLHTWMPDVAQGAPLPVAALLSIVPKIGAAVALARFLDLLPTSIGWQTLIAFIAVMTMTLGNLGALLQADVRRLLGWSSVSQSGYALMAVTVFEKGSSALPALILFLAGYAAANLALFAAVISLRGRTDFADYAGVGSARPVCAAVMVIGLLSLTGIPPLLGFFGKLSLFTVAINSDFEWLAVVAILNTVLSLFYYLRIIQVMYFEHGSLHIHLLGSLSIGTMICWGIAVIALGLGVQPVLAILDTASFAGPVLK